MCQASTFQPLCTLEAVQRQCFAASASSASINKCCARGYEKRGERPAPWHPPMSCYLMSSKHLPLSRHPCVRMIMLLPQVRCRGPRPLDRARRLAPHVERHSVGPAHSVGTWVEMVARTSLLDAGPVRGQHVLQGDGPQDDGCVRPAVALHAGGVASARGWTAHGQGPAVEGARAPMHGEDCAAQRACTTRAPTSRSRVRRRRADARASLGAADESHGGGGSSRAVGDSSSATSGCSALAGARS